MTPIDFPTADSSPTLARVRQYVVENFLYMYPDRTLADDDRLFAEGIIDSLGVMEVIGFLESEFALQVADDEATEGNFGSVAAIAAYVDRKLGAAATIRRAKTA